MGDGILLLLFRVAGSTTRDLDAENRFLFQFLRLFFADFAFVLSLANVRIRAGKTWDSATDLCMACQCCYRTRWSLVLSAGTPVLAGGITLKISVFGLLSWFLNLLSLDGSPKNITSLCCYTILPANAFSSRQQKASASSLPGITRWSNSGLLVFVIAP